jgi:hyperosmotically inducible protein
VKESFMKMSWIPALIAAAIASGAAIGQLPEVQPPPAPKSTVAQEADDAVITSKVKDAIASDSALKDMQVSVETADSVVTLAGTANARDQIARAVAVAKTVPGVKSVINILAVKDS